MNLVNAFIQSDLQFIHGRFILSVCQYYTMHYQLSYRKFKMLFSVGSKSNMASGLTSKMFGQVKEVCTIRH